MPKAIPADPGAPMPAAVTPKAQLAPLYGGPGMMNRAVANAGELAGQVYPGLDPELAAMFPQPNYDQYGRPIDLSQFPMTEFDPAAYIPRGEVDTPGSGGIVINPDYIGNDMLPAGVEPAITQALLDKADGGAVNRNAPIGGMDNLSPLEVDQILAQIRRHGGDDGMGMVDASPGTIAMMQGISPDDVAVHEFANPGASWGDYLDSRLEEAQSMPGGADINANMPGAAPAGVRVSQLLKLLQLPPEVQKFLGPRMGTLASLGGAAIGAGAAMSGDRDRPSMSTNATMRAPQMY